MGVCGWWRCRGYAVGQKMVNMTEPVGDIAILEDTDGDGIFDKRTVFQDKLVLPRALRFSTLMVKVGPAP